MHLGPIMVSTSGINGDRIRTQNTPGSIAGSVDRVSANKASLNTNPNRYPGGKGTFFQKLINLMPPHRVYIETHAGGGTVIRHKRPAEVNVAIDIDPAVKAAFCRNWPDSGVKFYTCDAMDYLSFLYPSHDIMIYADPPYLMSTRKSGSLYRHEYTYQQHVNLLSRLKELSPCKIMISGYWSEMYAQMLQGWHTATIEAMTRGGMATEWVWMNYDPPSELHDYSYLGNTFRDRERIKRKQRRWIANLKKMPTLERRALVELIKREY